MLGRWRENVGSACEKLHRFNWGIEDFIENGSFESPQKKGGYMYIYIYILNFDP